MRDGCPFCDYAGPSSIISTYFGDEVIVFEPTDPVTPGHLLVVPRAHVRSFADFKSVEDRDVIADTMAAACAVAKTYRNAGFDVNLITSAGAAATQTVEHLHVHVLPRSTGDGLKLPWSR